LINRTRSRAGRCCDHLHRLDREFRRALHPVLSICADDGQVPASQQTGRTPWLDHDRHDDLRQSEGLGHTHLREL